VFITARAFSFAQISAPVLLRLFRPVFSPPAILGNGKQLDQNTPLAARTYQQVREQPHPESQKA
jgi:hypothetical protein